MDWWGICLASLGCIHDDVVWRDSQELKTKISEFLELPRQGVLEVLTQPSVYIFDHQEMLFVCVCASSVLVDLTLKL